ncbi:sulfurtransferase [Comamonas sp. NoAH]|uniref:sulfurtransferase n=1 Tax=Comamonas halotolerans TaxID=3041496 RepID=UPI0024E15C43|nr:rhodanese-like domain-containing protein [Comamonas sp. NoAH]
MKNHQILALALTVGSSSWALAAPALLTPTELSPLLTQAEVRVVDIRDPKSFAENHIPGAVNAPYGKWRGPATNPGELPDHDKLVALLQSLGLTAQTHAVVVSTGKDATDFGAMARVYWTLKSLGLKELSIVNGGMQAWNETKLALSKQPVKVTPSTYAPSFDASWLSTREDITQSIKLSNAVLVDSRPDAFYQGKTQAPAAKLAGTLPGAVQLDFNQWFVPGTTRFVDTDKAKAIAAQIQVPSGQGAVAFCNTGHWAATDWFGMSEVAGMPNVKLYAGSMVDWTQQPDYPQLQNAPGRGEQLLRSTKQWWERKFN